MSAPYDPRAAALDALAVESWPDVSGHERDLVIAMEVYLTAAHALGRLGLGRATNAAWRAWNAGRDGRPLADPQEPPR